MAAKYCTECGHKKSILDKFCGQCGHKEGAATIPNVNKQEDLHVQNRPRIRLRSEMASSRRSEDDDQDHADEIDEVPAISKLDITIGGGNLDEGGNGYGCRKFKIDDLLK